MVCQEPSPLRAPTSSGQSPPPRSTPDVTSNAASAATTNGVATSVSGGLLAGALSPGRMGRYASPGTCQAATSPTAPTQSPTLGSPCSTPGTSQKHGSISPSRSGHDVANAGVHQQSTLCSNSGIGGSSNDLTAEEQEALRLQAFKAVVKDDTVTLADVLAKVPSDTWSSWQNKAALDLLTLSRERGSPASYSMMATALGIQRRWEMVTPAVLRFQPGTRARLCGLKAKPDLNGRVGIAIAFVAGKGRWQVQLEDSSDSILIREECLEPIDEQPISGNDCSGRDAPEVAGGEPVNKGPEVEKKKKKRKKKATGGEQSVFESTPANSRADVRSGTGAGSEFDQPEPSTYESTPKQSKADTSSMAAAGMESEQADSVYESKPKESKADVTSEAKLGAINEAEPSVFESQPKKSSAEVSHGGAASDPNEAAPSTFESNPSQSRADTGAHHGSGSVLGEQEPAAFESKPKESRAEVGYDRGGVAVEEPSVFAPLQSLPQGQGSAVSEIGKVPKGLSTGSQQGGPPGVELAGIGQDWAAAGALWLQEQYQAQPAAASGTAGGVASAAAAQPPPSQPQGQGSVVSVEQTQPTAVAPTGPSTGSLPAKRAKGGRSRRHRR